MNAVFVEGKEDNVDRNMQGQLPRQNELKHLSPELWVNTEKYRRQTLPNTLSIRRERSYSTIRFAGFSYDSQSQ